MKSDRGLIGFVARSAESVIVPDVTKDERYVSVREGTCAEMVVPVVLDGHVVGVFNLESDEVEAYDGHTAELLEAFGSQVAVVLERTRLHDEIVKSREMAKQLEIAHAIQRELLPEADPSLPGYDFSGVNVASGEVGGDYYGFIDVAPNQMGLAIADVSGKGVPAALIMASFRASLIAEIRNNFGVREICQKVNMLLYDSVEPGVFVTGFYGVLDTQAHRFTYCNAGHNPPYLLRSSGAIEQLESGGPPFGIVASISYEEDTIEISSGDVLLMYTDGVTEAEGPAGEQYGEERLKLLLQDVRAHTAKEIRRKIYRAVISFSAGATQLDDITMLVVKRL